MPKTYRFSGACTLLRSQVKDKATMEQHGFKRKPDWAQKHRIWSERGKIAHKIKYYNYPTSQRAETFQFQESFYASSRLASSTVAPRVST